MQNRCLYITIISPQPHGLRRRERAAPRFVSRGGSLVLWTKNFPCFFPLHVFFYLYPVVLNCTKLRLYAQYSLAFCTWFNAIFGPPVIRFPYPAPRRRGLCIVRDDFFIQKVIAHSRRRSSSPNRTRCAGLRFGSWQILRLGASIVFHHYKKKDTTLVVSFFLGSAPFGRSTLRRFKSSGEMNSPLRKFSAPWACEFTAHSRRGLHIVRDNFLVSKTGGLC